MKKTVNRIVSLKRQYLVLLLLFCFTPAMAQLELTVTPTNESCPGSGALAFSIDNAAPSTVTYTVYLLPDTANFIYNDTDTYIEGLSSGDYLVIASQVVNGSTVTDEVQVTISDGTVPLTYNLFGDPEFCGNDGKITVTVTSGNPDTFEIISGPVTVAPQPVPEFNNLPSGTYLIRVVDECGVGEVQSFQLFSEEMGLILTGPSFPDQALIDCNLLTMKFTVLAEDTDIGITYPLEAVMTVYPPDGSDPLVYNETVWGLPEFCNPTAIIPFYYDTPFTVDLVVTDTCGDVYELLNVTAQQKLQGTAAFVNADCGMKFMEINAFKYGAPYTIVFTNTPDGFDPETLCEDWPGPFTDSPVVFGDEENPVPWGTYEFEIHDACGRIAFASYENEEPEEDPEPETSTSNHDCEDGLGSILIYVPNYDLESVIITQAPPAYGTTPSDVSEFIEMNEDSPDFGRFQMNELPPGDYIFELIDTCGNPYTVEETIPEYEGENPGSHIRPGCDEGFGSTWVFATTNITVIQVTSGPDAFSTSYPVDVSANIYDGDLYMTGLPPGQYDFTFSTECSEDLTATSLITGYGVTVNDAEITRYCGSFDLYFNHQSNGVAGLGYYLQVYDPQLDQWVHPVSGLPVPADEQPDEDNSYKLENNETAFNLNFTGEMRILKVYKTFGNGSDGQKEIYCMQEIYAFSFYDDLEITQLYNLTCVGTVADIEVTAVGVEPITYKIISKNGEPFIIDNGTDNIFEDLESAVYIIEVRDPCGNMEPLQFNIADLPSLVNAYDADDLEDCDTDGDGQQTFDLSVQDEDILNGQDPTEVHLSYHDNLNDAEANANQLPAGYTASVGTKTIYGRVTSNADPDCFDLESFDIIVNGAGSLTMETVWPACEGESVTVIADPGYESYLWSNGAQTPFITVTEGGTYTVTVTDANGCTITQDVEVVISSLPQIHHIEVNDWTDNSNVITVVMEESDTPENFEYSLDGINYQGSPIFTNLAPGEYTIYVRDVSGCGNDGAEAYLLTYPKFFTPNGDGINETWRIRYSMNEPDMLIYIFDRYGKLIIGFGPNSPGWDGTLDGKKLPSTDYWFVVKRQNGKEYKGHFSMIR